MTVYGLIGALVNHCGPQASFGDVKLWWSERHQRLFIAKSKPCDDAEELAV